MPAKMKPTEFILNTSFLFKHFDKLAIDDLSIQESLVPVDSIAELIARHVARSHYTIGGIPVVINDDSQKPTSLADKWQRVLYDWCAVRFIREGILPLRQHA